MFVEVVDPLQQPAGAFIGKVIPAIFIACATYDCAACVDWVN